MLNFKYIFSTIKSTIQSATLRAYDNICDGTENCKCKEDVSLRKEDFEQNVLLMTKEEKEVQERFNQLCNWGFPSLWTEVFIKFFA